MVVLLAAAPARAQDRLDWGEVLFDRDRGITLATVTGPADSVWRLLRPMLVDAGIPITLDDREAGLIGNRRFRAVRKLGNVPLSRFFSCGNSMTGPNADNYHVFIELVGAVSALAAERTRFQLQLAAEAVDVPGGRSERVPCSTTGRFEHALTERLNAAFPGTK